MFGKYLCIAFLFFKIIYVNAQVVYSEGKNEGITAVSDSLSVSLSQVEVISSHLLNQIMQTDLKMNPVESSQDLLRKIPGLFIAQHAGGGKAEQIFMRGFDSDHGTDIHVAVDDVPVNMVSHAHGQGYADLHFVIPETVETIDFGKGSYYADKGDFNTSGYVNLKTFDKPGNSLIKIEGGMFNSTRMAGLLRLIDEKSHNMYAAGEYSYTDGPFEKSQHFNRVNLFIKDNYQINKNACIEWRASTFSSNWGASGQIPERAVKENMISRWGSIDPSEGGNTGRTNLALMLNHAVSEKASRQSLLYFTHYDFNLFSNFTLYLNDPEYGDEIQQKESRNIYGMEHKYTKQYTLENSELLWKSKIGLRYDDIDNTGLIHVWQRTTALDTLSLAAIQETNLNACSSVEWTLGKWMIYSGLRLDYFIFNVDDKTLAARLAQRETAFRLSPKLNFFYNLGKYSQFFLQTGMGFHSNDARVVIAQKGREILPYSLEADLGALFKPLPGLTIQPSVWYLYLQQEFVYVGDEAVVEPSGKTLRLGVDFSIRYQPLPCLYLDADVNYAHPRAMDAPEGENYIPLAPILTCVGGVAFRSDSGFGASLRFRYMKDRPANEDNSVVAKGYFVNDLTLVYALKNWELTLEGRNIFNVKWYEAQFNTETRLKNEINPVSEICFTPGYPFFLKAGLKINF
ncbi:MAG: TonB-dependent receptor [Dysgonamonadaceae bacterium]|jgi:outer membrane receptor protein involved in Fe transport|nr:TonB-dependent receptor [Dysgonamonadaceae bacterium]